MNQANNLSSRRKAALKEGNPDYLAKRAELIRIAATLFKKKGFKATTLNDIAGEAGLDKATVYYYVGSKNEFYKEAVWGILDENVLEGERIIQLKTANPRQKLQLLIEMLMRSYEESYPYMYVYIQEAMQKVAYENTAWAREMTKQTHRFEKLVIQLIGEGIENGQFRKELSAPLAANALFGMLNWTHRWYAPGSKYTMEEITDQFSKIFFDGLEN